MIFVRSQCRDVIADRVGTYVNRDMTHHCRVIWESNILGILMATTSCMRIGLLIYYEGSLNIDSDRARVSDGIVKTGRMRSRPLRLRRGRRFW